MNSTRTPSPEQEHICAAKATCPSDIGQWLCTFDNAGKLRASQWIHRLARHYPNVDAEQLHRLLRSDMHRRLYDHPPQCEDAQRLFKIIDAPTKNFMNYIGLVLEFVKLPRAEQDTWGGAIAWAKRGQPEAEPTPRQLWKLYYLGHRGPKPQSCKEASRLIHALLQRNTEI